MIDNILDSIEEYAKKAWQWIRKIVVKILNFTKNIVEWFKNPDRMKALEEDKERLAVVIKYHLTQGEYRTVNCIFNKKTGEIDGVKNETNNYAQGTISQEIDSETQKQFGDKPMIVLE